MEEAIQMQTQETQIGHIPVVQPKMSASSSKFQDLFHVFVDAYGEVKSSVGINCMCK